MATYELSAQVDIVDLLDDVSYSEEEDVLLELLERFNPKNVNAALREYFEDKNERVTEYLGFVNYFEEERTLLDILEKFDDHHVNAALREYFRFQTRNKLPDFVDAEKL
jgi:hypothetical protein